MICYEVEVVLEEVEEVEEVEEEVVEVVEEDYHR
jgi:hypothetical protein